jgi:hypothetical protein
MLWLEMIGLFKNKEDLKMKKNTRANKNCHLSMAILLYFDNSNLISVLFARCLMLFYANGGVQGGGQTGGNYT